MQQNLISKISKIYAQSLLAATEEKELTSSVLQELKQTIETINSSSDLQVVMKNTAISNNKKIEIINSIFEKKINKLLLSFLIIIVEKNHFDKLTEIYDYYEILLDKKLGKKKVKIISAIEIEESTKTKIIATIEQKIKQSIIPKWEINNDIIAGLIFKFDDYVIDSSVKGKIKNLNKIKGIL